MLTTVLTSWIQYKKPNRRILDAASDTDGVQKAQSIRIKRWRLAQLAYVFVITAAYLAPFAGMGSMSSMVFAFFLAAAVVGNAVFYCLFKTNRNLRFADPSLTFAQMIFSTFWGMIPLYFMPGARLVFQLFYLISFCFGMMRFTLSQYFKVFFTAVSLYFVILVLDYLGQRPGFFVSTEVFQFVLFILVLFWFTVFGSYVSSLRSRLRAQHAELRNAHQALQAESEERKRAMSDRSKLETQLQRARKMEAIGTLAGGVAHDLNNILSGVVSYPDLILMDLPEKSPFKDALLTIKQTGLKAAAIVQDLLTLARRGVTVTEVVNLNAIVSDFLKSPEHRKIERYHPHVKVRACLENDLLNTIGSPVHLSKTVMNLVSNAAEAMPEGGTIHIETKNRYIDQPTIRYDKIAQGDYVTVVVSDTGTGLTQEDRERIFEPFYTKKVMGRSGTGLGMAVVWGTVKDHGGFIDIDSDQEKGTQITLLFPATREKLSSRGSVLSSEHSRGNGESILVVDDVGEQRKVSSDMLTRLGYSVKSVSSGEEAIDYLKDRSVDLVVLDMIMDPGIDGMETYKRILELHPGQRAIITSGFSETDRVKAALKLGVGAYIKKPFLLEKIGMAVRTELDKHSSRS